MISRKIVKTAIGLLKDGWVQGELVERDDDGGEKYCLMGALSAAYRLENNLSKYNSMKHTSSTVLKKNKLLTLALGRTLCAIHKKDNFLDEDLVENISSARNCKAGEVESAVISFNDESATEKKDVLNLLKKVDKTLAKIEKNG